MFIMKYDDVTKKSMVFNALVIICCVLYLMSDSNDGKREPYVEEQYTAEEEATTRDPDECKVEDCTERKVIGGTYCYDYTCGIPGCAKRVMEGSYFCEEHQPADSNKTNSNKKKYNSNSNHKYDPYDVHDYDDPDDFAEEWAEEFGDGNYDDGYDDAYDYWEDEAEE